MVIVMMRRFQYASYDGSVHLIRVYFENIIVIHVYLFIFCYTAAQRPCSSRLRDACLPIVTRIPCGYFGDGSGRVIVTPCVCVHIPCTSVTLSGERDVSIFFPY